MSEQYRCEHGHAYYDGDQAVGSPYEDGWHDAVAGHGKDAAALSGWEPWERQAYESGYSGGLMDRDGTELGQAGDDPDGRRGHLGRERVAEAGAALGRGHRPEGEAMTERVDLDASALRLRHVYNPRAAGGSWGPGNATERDHWYAVVHAARRATTTDREELAAALHGAYVAAISVQRERGWPPLAESERDRWLAVADAVLSSEDGADDE
jgi:hypothetical protein